VGILVRVQGDVIRGGDEETERRRDEETKRQRDEEAERRRGRETKRRCESAHFVSSSLLLFVSSSSTQFSRGAQKSVDVVFPGPYSDALKGGDNAMAKKKAAKKTTKKTTKKK
jgi:hypothetical protein